MAETKIAVAPNGNSCRQSALSVLKNVSRSQEDKFVAIEILIKVIPWKLLSPEDENTLHNFFWTLNKL